MVWGSDRRCRSICWVIVNLLSKTCPPFSGLFYAKKTYSNGQEKASPGRGGCCYTRLKRGFFFFPCCGAASTGFGAGSASLCGLGVSCLRPSFFLLSGIFTFACRILNSAKVARSSSGDGGTFVLE